MPICRHRPVARALALAGFAIFPSALAQDSARERIQPTQGDAAMDRLEGAVTRAEREAAR
ncbi:MAG: hypothetical protein LKM31_00050 [Sphingobium sp.]|jgi:hypothetical protein|nr:hypothetical protein [Sphingobium sp.]